jgi:recombinational DNA repair protein (RecF pathway)
MLYPIEAVVLKKYRINQNKLIITCFSKEYGKIDVFVTDSK